MFTMMLQPNQWSCTPTAFAIAMETTPKDIITAIGHDGSEIVHPELQEPLCRRGFHVQECIDVCIGRFVCVTPIEALPMGITPGAEDDIQIFQDSLGRISQYLVRHIGVLTGQTLSGVHHAVAWDGEQCWCPSGRKHGIEDFLIETFWMFC